MAAADAAMLRVAFNLLCCPARQDAEAALAAVRAVLAPGAPRRSTSLHPTTSAQLNNNQQGGVAEESGEGGSLADRLSKLVQVVEEQLGEYEGAVKSHQQPSRVVRWALASVAGAASAH